MHKMTSMHNILFTVMSVFVLVSVIIRFICIFSPKMRSRFGFMLYPRRRRDYMRYDDYTYTSSSYCPDCGRGVDAGDNFCRGCGKKL